MSRFTAIDVERITGAAADVVAEHQLPSLGVAVATSAGLEYAETFGHADVESGRELTPAHRQRIGSITKTMVGLCTLALVDEGKLALDDRVQEHLPDLRFDGPAESLQIRHLLTHTGGIGEAPTLEHLRDPEEMLWSSSADVPPLAERYPDGILIEVAPGTKWAYANHGWALVGEIVSRCEAKPIEDVVQRRIFEPLAMQSSDLRDAPHPELTTGYHRPPSEDALELMRRAGRDVPEETPVDGANIRGEYRWIPARAAGAVQCSLLDLARYAQALLRGGEGIVRRETFDSMLRPQWCPDPRLQYIGLAFFWERLFGHRSFGHGGGVVGGWNTSLKVLPDEDLALVLHLNLAYDHFGRVEQSLLRSLLDAAPHRPPEVAVDEAILRSAPGVYEATAGKLTNTRIAGSTGRIQISIEDDGLVLHSRRGPWKTGVRMLPADALDPRFLELESGELVRPNVVLTTDDRGQVTGLLLDRLVRMVRNDTLEPWA